MLDLYQPLEFEQLSIRCRRVQSYKNDENEVKDWNSEYRKSGDLKTVDGLRHETFSQAYMMSYILHTHEKDHYGTTNFLTGAGL